MWNLMVRAWLLWMTCLICTSGIACGDEPKPLIRGTEFRTAWNTAISARVDQRSLVHVMDQFVGSRQMAWVIDRRLDPDTTISAEHPLEPLSELLSQLLGTVQVGATTIGNSVVIGPLDKINELRTLAEQQRIELQQSRLAVPRKQVLAQTRDLHWDDLAEPRQLIQQVAERAKIKITGIDLIPHDVWRRGDLAGVTVGEALTVLAWQFDLRLEWQPDGHATLVEIHRPVQISRTYTIPGARRESAKSEFPDLTWTDSGKAQKVSGRIEELEALERWIKGTTKPGPKPEHEPRDWRNRKFTLRVKNAPLGDVLKALKQQGIPLEWDESVLTTRGIDFKAKIQLDLKDASPEELLAALCQAANLKYEITAKAATLTLPHIPQ